MKFNARQISVGGLIAAIYLIITVTPGISGLSYGPIQVRLAEALTVLPFLYPGAIGGLFVGCLLANIFGPVGIEDVVFGPLITLAAAWATYLLRRTGRPVLAPLPPVLFNALGVSAYLHILFRQPYWWLVIYIAAGQFIACYLLGYPLLRFVMKRKKGFN